MLIANPIYDVVFKYLMEDSKVAKLLLSAIIGEEIIELNLKPQELTGEIPKADVQDKEEENIMVRTSLTVYRLDFAATIKTEEGSKVIVIEIQKAKLLNDVMRFRRYLGKQYQNNDYYYIKKNENGRDFRYGFPIVSIYFLGERLDVMKGVPIIKVDNIPIDLYSGEQIAKKEAFVESLTHKSYIISIPDLSKKRRTELENLLSIFDQSSIDDSNYILNVKETDFPEKFRPIIKRLQSAAVEENMRNQMELEEDFVWELADYERMIAEKDAKLLEVITKVQEAESKVQEAESKMQEAESKMQEAESKMQEEKMQKEVAQTRITKMVKNFAAKGMSIEDIADMTGLSMQEVELILITKG